MPVSSPLGKQMIKEWFKNHPEITAVVDVGAGAGTYFDLVGDIVEKTAIEVWHDYIIRYNLRDKYRYVIESDIREVIFKLPEIKHDCIILGDIVEHLPKADAILLLERARKYFMHLVVSIPIGDYPQESLEGNPFERHQSTWYTSELLHLINPRHWQLFPYEGSLQNNVGIGVFIR